MSDTQFKIGTLLSEHQTRDAIHIAVAPVVATESLSPGQSIVVADGNAKATSDAERGVGIVDPFLRSKVSAGSRFFIFLYPNTITGLRHQWEHPAFEQEPQKDDLLLAAERVAHTCGKTYDALIDDMRSYNWSADGSTFGGDYILDNSERYKDVPSDDWQKCWQHFERVTGEKVHDKYRSAPYTCSC